MRQVGGWSSTSWQVRWDLSRAWRQEGVSGQLFVGKASGRGNSMAKTSPGVCVCVSTGRGASSLGSVVGSAQVTGGGEGPDARDPASHGQSALEHSEKSPWGFGKCPVLCACLSVFYHILIHLERLYVVFKQSFFPHLLCSFPSSSMLWNAN